MHVQVSTDDLVLKDGAYEDLSLAKCSVPAFGPSATFTGCDQNSLVTKEALHDVVVKNLSDQIRELKDVNARIIASTQDKDREIQRLRNAAAKGQPSVFDTSEGDPTNAKIVELARHKRELTAKYEAEHTKAQKLLAENIALDVKLAETQKTSRSPLQTARRKAASSRSSAVFHGGDSEIKQKMLAATEKAAVTSHEVHCLRLQNQKLQRLLERELGRGSDVNQLLREENPSFKARDEQIRILKGKVETLKKELEAFRNLDQEIGEWSLSSSAGHNRLLHRGSSSVVRSASVETNGYNLRHRELLTMSDQKRREDYSVLVDENQKLQRALSEVKTKLSAEKARNDYLSKENIRVSQFNRHVLATCKKDAELIQYFQTTINDLRKTLGKTSLLPPAPSMVIQAIVPYQNRQYNRSPIRANYNHTDEKHKHLEQLHFDHPAFRSSPSTSQRESDPSSTKHSATIAPKAGHRSLDCPPESDSSLSDSLLEEGKPGKPRRATVHKPCAGNLKSLKETLRRTRKYVSSLTRKLQDEEIKLQNHKENALIQKESADMVKVDVDHLLLQIDHRSSQLAQSNSSRIRSVNK